MTWLTRSSYLRLREAFAIERVKALMTTISHVRLGASPEHTTRISCAYYISCGCCMSLVYE